MKTELSELKISQAISEKGAFEEQFSGSNNVTAIAWAKQYLDAGFKVTLKSGYFGGWYTNLTIEPQEAK